MKRHVTNELATIDELNKWHIFAAYGHYHQAALFDPKTKDISAKDPSKTPTGHFFRPDILQEILTTDGSLYSVVTEILTVIKPPMRYPWLT